MPSIVGAGGRRPARSRAGFTVAETALAMTLLLVALMSASAATLRVHGLQRQNREKVVAQNAMRSMAEEIHAVSAAQIADDPEEWSTDVVATFSAGGAIGNQFNAPELIPTGANTPIGTVTLITDETATDADLGLQLGMPRDLNGDGDASDTDVRADAHLLPVVLTVSWNGASGVQNMQHGFFLLGY